MTITSYGPYNSDDPQARMFERVQPSLDDLARTIREGLKRPQGRKPSPTLYEHAQARGMNACIDMRNAKLL